MPVYLFTLHTYRSWMPANRRGYVRRKAGCSLPGVLPPDSEMHQRYADRARGPAAVRLDRLQCCVAVDAVRAACDRYGWRCHAAVAVWSHVHALISWPGFHDTAQVRKLLKRTITQGLNRDSVHAPQRILSAAGSRKRVKDRSHFDHLMQCYLPSHQRYAGVLWRETDPPEKDPPGPAEEESRRSLP